MPVRPVESHPDRPIVWLSVAGTEADELDVSARGLSQSKGRSSARFPGGSIEAGCPTISSEYDRGFRRANPACR